MFTDEDYLDELLKSIEPITKQNEVEPEPENVIEEQVVADFVVPVEEPETVLEMPNQLEEVYEKPTEPEVMVEMPNQTEAQVESSVVEFGSGDMGMSEAEIDALINAAKNTPLTTGGSSPNYVEDQGVAYSQEKQEEFENYEFTNETPVFEGNPEIIQTGDINDMDIPMDLFADPDSFETISADNVSGQELMDLGLFSDDAEIVAIETPAETNADEMPGVDDGEDIAALLGQFSDDTDISDIMSILEKDEKNEAVDESMFEAYDEAEKLFEEAENPDAEIAAEDQAGEEGTDKKKLRKKKEKPVKEKKEKPVKVKKEKVKKEKKVKQPKEDKPEEDIKEKTPGFFSKLVTIMTQEEDEDATVPEISETGITDENADILRELSKEDKKKKIKGDKKDKKNKKDKKGKKDKKPVKEESEDDIREKSDKEDDEASDNKKNKKKNKKEKKEKKPKKLKVMELSVPEKKIPRKYIIATLAFCFTIMLGIMITSSVYTNLSNLKTARWAFDNGDYQTAYEHLYGEELDEQDQLIFDKAAVILTIERKMDSYENFKKLGMETEALNALFEGVRAYHRINAKAEELKVISKVDRVYAEIMNKFAEYGLSEAEVEEILAYESDAAYTKKLESIVTGVPFEELYE